MRELMKSKTVYVAISSVMLMFVVYVLIYENGEEFTHYSAEVVKGGLLLLFLLFALFFASVTILMKRGLGLAYWELFMCQGFAFVLANKLDFGFMQTASNVSYFGLDRFFHFLITHDLYVNWFVHASNDEIIELTVLGVILRLTTCFIYGYSLDLLSVKRQHRRLKKMQYDYYINDVLVGEKQSFDELDKYIKYIATLDNGGVSISVYEGEIYFDLVNIESFDVEYTEENELRLTNLKKYESDT